MLARTLASATAVSSTVSRKTLRLLPTQVMDATSAAAAGAGAGGVPASAAGAGMESTRHMSTVPVLGREPILFTPGPLTTSLAVKQAMLIDYGSRDQRFVDAVREVQNGLLDLAHVSQESGYECVIMQGSGTTCVESVVSSVIPREGAKLLILANGAYGDRIAKMAKVHDIPHVVKSYPETAAPSAADAKAAMEEDPDITHVAVIHHETTAGTLNPIEEIGAAVREARPDVVYIVDSMSAFGCYDVDVAKHGIDYLVSSSNKNIEGVPGFAYAICRRDHLVSTAGWARSLALDLYDQWKGLQANGQFRFTPPTHSILAFRQALLEHKAEGGVAGRRARYERNFEVLKAGMEEMGFNLYIGPDLQSCIISTFLFPDDPKFDFDVFYKELGDLGIVIYPGKLTKAPCFRLGSIGRLYEHDMRMCLLAIRHVLTKMGVSLPVKQVEV